ncbi:hypothetical protein [Roseibium sp. RKSG952]|uniref:hypothetical protein n=1 Tax=Roseibium sp. RKSG952 TaxID=2529384 RepID=UPI0012BB8B78|nr:hypothetical protein [Roseibium sp. RKSG952]MTH94917.1 hypothetical protein [Roseibium sp. RKSG952]
MKHVKDFLVYFIRTTAPLLLCLFGGLFLVAAVLYDLPLFGSIAAVLLWAYAIDMSSSVARSQGYNEGAIKALEAVASCDKMVINVNHKNQSDT